MVDLCKWLCMTDNVKSRLKAYLKYKHVSQSELERRAGLSTGFVARVGDSIRVVNQEKIKSAFPDINFPWILTGIGNMIKNNNGSNIGNRKSDNEFLLKLFKIIDDLNMQIKEKDRQIASKDEHINDLTRLLKKALEAD